MGVLQDDVRIDPVLKDVIQLPTQAPLATVAGATVADIQLVATALNTLIANMKAQGLMK